MSACLTRDEKKDLEFFFQHLLIDKSGAYVLFGSKPFCDGGFFPHVVQRKNSPYKRDLMKGWQAWEKVKRHIPNNRFLMVMRDRTVSPLYPDGRRETHVYKETILLDIEKTALVLAENYETFKALVGMDFHPYKIVFEIENPDSVFWNKCFNRVTSGLLYGFGKNNALLFNWREEFHGEGGKIGYCLQDIRLPCFACADPWEWDRWGMKAFAVPGFVSFDCDETVKRYEMEKKRIQKIYRGRDFLEVTLRRLAS